MRINKILIAVFLNTIIIVSSLAQVMPLVYGVENTAADYPKPFKPLFSDLPSIPSLPDPFTWADGRGRIMYKSDWRYRRAELGAQFQQYEIGEKPPRPDSIQANFRYTDSVLTVIITKNGKTLTLTSKIILPAGTGPFPAVISMTSFLSIPSTIFSSRNIARITFNHNQVTTYNDHKITDPYYQLYPHLNTANTGQYSAWSWGVSRLIDGLELVQNDLPINLNRIAVVGCSYAGKLALFAGAFDERVALTLAQESGGGGYVTWRFSQTLEGVETLAATNYSWFSDSMKQFSGDVSKLPIDHHQLMAMVAPRALFVTGNPGWVWMADESGYVGSKAVKEVYNALGIPDRFGFSQIGGHNHCQVPSQQISEYEAFVEKFLLGNNTVNTEIANTPYTTNLSPWITWTTPTLIEGSSDIKWASLSYPSDLQLNLDSVVTFKWKKVEDVEKYYIQLSLNSSFTNIDKSDSTNTNSDTTKTFDDLLKGKRYFWRVKVKSSGGVDLWSDIWSFRTAAPLPEKPQLASATPTSPPRADLITLRWNKVQYAEQYLAQISTVQSFATIRTQGTTSDTIRNFSGLTRNVEYFWRVQASNTAGSSPWSDVWSFVAGATDVIDVEQIPATYSISQNYPNPFNPNTKIKFSLPKSSFVKITVFDILGREIHILKNEELKAGYHEIDFEANNLPSGIYFYKMQSGKFVATKKMVLMQ